MALKKKLTSDLKNYLKHYSYEIEMLKGAYILHDSLKKFQEIDPKSATIKVLLNTTLESFLVHSRCLIQFYNVNEDLRTDDRDFCAQDYIKKWVQVIKVRKHTTNLSKDRFDEISRQLSHMSRSREEGKKWPHFEMLPALMELHSFFKSNLPKLSQKKLND